MKNKITPVQNTNNVAVYCSAYGLLEFNGYSEFADANIEYLEPCCNEEKYPFCDYDFIVKAFGRVYILDECNECTKEFDSVEEFYVFCKHFVDKKKGV